MVDKSASAVHDIGSTQFVYATDPSWCELTLSESAKRLKLLMPREVAFFENTTPDDEQQEIDFPVLQPIATAGDMFRLEPWDSLDAAVVINVQFVDLLHVLPGSDYSAGEVVVPFSSLLENGKLQGWYTIADDDEPPVNPDGDDQSDEGNPQLYLELRWIPPSRDSCLQIETEREASNAIQEEMLRSAQLSRKEKDKLSLLGSSIGALNTVRGISSNLQVVQNTLGSVLDVVESCLHLFDFTVGCSPLHRVRSSTNRSLLLVVGAVRAGSLQVDCGAWNAVACFHRLVAGFDSSHCLDGRIGKSSHCYIEFARPAPL